MTRRSIKRSLTEHRRRFLQAAGACIATLAGCNDTSPLGGTTTESGDDADDSTPSSTETVVFTNSSTSTTSAETTTTTVETVFSGGGLRDFLDAVREAAATDSGRLVVEEDTYRFENLDQRGVPNGYHAVLKEVSGVTVEGNGATFVFTEPTVGGLNFLFCGEINLRDLHVDYDPVPFTQGEIAAYDQAARTLVLTLDEGYPSLDHGMFEEAERVWASIHTADGAFIRGYRAIHPLFFDAMTRLDERRFELRLTEGSPTVGLNVGRRLTVVARNNQAALRFHDVDQLTVENVHVHATNGAAYDTVGCTDPVYRDCTVAAPAESDRHIGADADGFRLIDCVSSTRVVNCRAESIEDDAIVVQRNRTPIIEFLDDRTVDVSEWPVHAKPGDIFDVLSPTGERKGTLPPVADMTEEYPTPIPRAKPVTLTFEDPVTDLLNVGDFIGNRAVASQNFLVRNNTVRNLRGKAVRVAAGRGVVEDNHLEGASHNTVELECETAGHFIPNGPVEDVTVRNNTLVRSGLNWYAHEHPAAIRLHHRPYHELTTDGHPNRNVTIVGNTIRNTASAGVDLQDAHGVDVVGNTLADLNRLQYENGGYGFRLRNVRDVALTENRVRGTGDALLGFGTRSRSNDVMLSANTVTIDGDDSTGALESQ